VFVTTTIIQWIPVFADQWTAEQALRLLEEERKSLDMGILGYVLKPSHFHGVMRSARKGDLSILMRKWKAKCAKMIIVRCRVNQLEWLAKFAESAYRYKLTADQEHQVWNPRIDDFMIRTEKELNTKLNYIHGNPLKHQIAENIEDYPYSSYLDYNGGKNRFVTVMCGQGKP
jgi:REP element-mobilizing transposase RayT